MTVEAVPHGMRLDGAVPHVDAPTENRPGAWLGIDEAGRGSVLGPLVVGGFLVDPGRLDEVKAAGARDSKALTVSRREEVHRAIGQVGRRVSVLLPPEEVDRSVRDHGLNSLEARAFARLVRRCRPSRVFVDACDPVAARFGAKVAALSGHIAPVDARHHADRDLPIVGAASIVAKVRRDREIARLQARAGVELGCGYPHDATTVDYVRACLAAGRRPGDGVRYSWATATRLIVVRPLERFAETP